VATSQTKRALISSEAKSCVDVTAVPAILAKSAIPRLDLGVQPSFAMLRYQWSRLNSQQVGAYTEYFVKMELTMFGFQVYSTEVDDRGIDFVARHERGPFFQVQVKSPRSLGYVFMQKSKFELTENLHLALGLLFEGQPPELYLIPSIAWQSPNGVFVERNYEVLKSLPEWGVNISRRNLPALAPYTFEKAVEQLIGQAGG
jgi:hypothetical protein